MPRPNTRSTPAGVKRQTFNGQLVRPPTCGGDEISQIIYTSTDVADRPDRRHLDAARRPALRVDRRPVADPDHDHAATRRTCSTCSAAAPASKTGCPATTRTSGRRSFKTDPRPLLESEALAMESGGGGTDNPGFTDGDAYGLSYVRVRDKAVDVFPGVTTVWDVEPGRGRHVGGWTVHRPEPTSARPTRSHADDHEFRRHHPLAGGRHPHEPGTGGNPRHLRQQLREQTVTAGRMAKGGGWLRTKTYITGSRRTPGRRTTTPIRSRPTTRSRSGSRSNDSSTITISSKKDLLIQGNSSRPTTGHDHAHFHPGIGTRQRHAAVFNDAPDCHRAAGDVRCSSRAAVRPAAERACRRQHHRHRHRRHRQQPLTSARSSAPAAT